MKNRIQSIWLVVISLFVGWSVLLASLPLILCVFIWIATWGYPPYSSLWDSVASMPTPMGKTGSYIHCATSWMLIERGEVWALHDVNDMPQQPTPIPLGKTYLHPMPDMWGGASFSQGDAQKYWGVNSGFLGFHLDWSSGAGRGGRSGWRITGTAPLWVGGLPLVVVLAVRLWKRVRRKGGGCAACGYNLRGHKVGEKCPECGTEIAVKSGILVDKRSVS